MIFKVYSPDERISNISLKKRILLRNVEITLLLKAQEELKLAYEDFGDNSAIVDNGLSFFAYASFIFEKEGEATLHRLHIGDVVSINAEDNFAIIRMIFSHQKNDLLFAFVIVDWFEELNQKKLSCPVYRLQMTNTNWRRVFSICLVNTDNVAHFIHCCKDKECVGSKHDSRNDLYIRNLYFFKAV
jgi:hypothetical protein